MEIVLNPKQALAILNEARAAGFYEGSVPEDQELLVVEAGIIVEEAKAAETAQVKSDVVQSILYIARVDHNPPVEAQTTLDLESAAKVGAHTPSPTAAESLGQDSNGNQSEVAQDRSQDSNDAQLLVAPEDDEQGQTAPDHHCHGALLSHHYIARAEAIARIKKERLPIPPELDGEPPILPRDMTKLSDTQLRRLNSEFNAAFARANYIASIEAADEYAAKMIGDKLFVRALAKAALGERKSEATRKAEADAADDVSEWREKASDHHIKARIYKDLRDGLKDALDRISREWSMRIGERQHA